MALAPMLSSAAVDPALDRISAPGTGVLAGACEATRSSGSYSEGLCDHCAFLSLIPNGYDAPDLQYTVSECLGWPALADDRVEIWVENGEIVVDHRNVTYNCCASIVVQLVDARPLLQIVECERFAFGPCWCICTYDVYTRIPGLPCGQYRVEVVNCSGSKVYGSSEVTVP